MSGWALLIWLATGCTGLGPTTIEDLDGDGWCTPPADAWDARAYVCKEPAQFGDCDDTDPLRFPHAEERCNGIDDSCDGHIGPEELDGDDDGDVACRTDCDDADPTRSGDLPELCNGVDDNCNGEIDDGLDIDIDGDGFTAPTSCFPGSDCDDSNPDVHPRATEICNGIDDDCDSAVDNADAVTWYPDLDGDGHGDRFGIPVDVCAPPVNHVRSDDDCDDTNAERYPDVPERCDDTDWDCDGDAYNGQPPASWWVDVDRDGWGDETAETISCDDLSATHIQRGEDCDDTRANIHPEAPELCDEVDQDCSGNPRDGAPTQPWFLDADGDSYGSTAAEPSVSACEAPEDYVAVEGDCDDGDADIFPGAPERCNLLDDNCDTDIDEGYTRADMFPDVDGDGVGDDTLSPILGCHTAPGHSAIPGDCDDGDPSVFPGQTDVCNDLNDDCDDEIDEDAPTRAWFVDNDGDGAGRDTSRVDACARPPGEDITWVEVGGDCADADPTRHPLAGDPCDRIDNDCDGAYDEDAPTITWYQDFDRDGAGTDDASGDACMAPGDGTGWASVSGDCDDSDPTRYPLAIDICDNQDNDCDDEIDEDVPTRPWYADGDADGAGQEGGEVVQGCQSPAGDWAEVLGDCDDADPERHPLAAEICDDIDNNCNNEVDEDLALLRWYEDADGDGRGKDDVVLDDCNEPSVGPGWATTDGDCDDTQGTTWPGAPELCDGVDNNCDNDIDEGLTIRAYYRDPDGDGFASSTEPAVDDCAPPSEPGPWVFFRGDCDADDPVVFPGAPELCDYKDNDCDGDVDDGAAGSTAWTDEDRDGYGSGEPFILCPQAPSTPYASTDGDCAPDNPLTHPFATESCDDLSIHDCDDSTTPVCPVFIHLEYAAWRGPSLLDLDQRMDPASTTCATDTDTWMTPWHAVPDPLDAVPTSRIHISWEAQDAQTVSIVGIADDLPPSGTLDVSAPYESGTIEIRAESTTGGLATESFQLNAIADPHIYQHFNLSCRSFPQPDTWRPSLGLDAMASTCSFDDFSTQDTCSTCANTTADAGAWSVGTGNTLTFDPAAAAHGDVSSRHRVFGRPMLLPTDANYWLTASIDGGDHMVIPLVAFDGETAPTPACTPGGHVVPGTPLYPSTDPTQYLWNHGSPTNVEPAWDPSPWQGTYAWVRPGLELRDRTGSSTSTVTVHNLSVLCCGDGCGVCVDPDADGWGPWCGTQSWDCDQTDAEVYPGALPDSNGVTRDCDDPAWTPPACP